MDFNTLPYDWYKTFVLNKQAVLIPNKFKLTEHLNYSYEFDELYILWVVFDCVGGWAVPLLKIMSKNKNTYMLSVLSPDTVGQHDQLLPQRPSHLGGSAHLLPHQQIHQWLPRSYPGLRSCLLQRSQPESVPTYSSCRIVDYLFNRS